MIEIIKDHWSMIIVTGAGLIWVGRVRAALDDICTRLREHGKEIASLQRVMQPRAACATSQEHCQADIRRALDDYRAQFMTNIQEIKHMINQMDQKREESRKELFQLFREIDEKREANKQEIEGYFRQYLQMVKR